MYKKITAAQAKKINAKLGLEFEDGDGVRTFWATNDEETEITSFDSKRERDRFLERANRPKL